MTTTTTASPSFAAIVGTYVGGTADGGSVYIRSDGSSRFLAPDGNSCPTCSTAGSPIASIDFALKSLTSTGPDSYNGAGVVTNTSDIPWASSFPGRPDPGASVSLTISSGGHLTLSFLPTNDVLNFSSRSALYTNTPPCTVATVTGPVQATQSGATVAGVTCAIDEEWVAASVSDHGIDEVMVLQADFTQWVVVDRPTVCNNHDVPSDLYQAACGSD